MDYTKNQLCDVTITDISETGEGIGRVDGYTLFVKDAILGDTVTARLTKVKKNYAFARLERIINKSEFRTDPPCSLHKRCGGCQIQALSYDAQLIFKQKRVYGNLKRIGGFSEDFLEKAFEPIAGMENPFRYRNKAQYPIGYDKEGNLIAGFYAGRTHDIIPCTDCLLGVNENKDILDSILVYMKENKVTAYDEKTGKGLIRHVLIRKGFETGEIMVCLVISKKSAPYIPNADSLIGKLTQIKGIRSISVSVNTENTNVIMGNEIHTLWGEDTITDILLGKSYRISPLAFFQVNPVQCAKLYEIVREYAEIKEGDEVWDICCGIGTIALHLSSCAGKIHGIEIVPEAINDAKYNAKVNNVTNADFFCADATEYLREHAKEMKADVIVMDPPRKGMTKEALQAVVSVSPDRIVYVSCDPSTLARDLKLLCENGYEIKKVRPVDMFPHSVHVETVVLMSKVK